MKTNTVTYTIKYHLSDECIEQHFERTGERPDKKQEFVVDAPELSRELRQAVDALPKQSYGSDDGARYLTHPYISKGRESVGTWTERFKNTLIDGFPNWKQAGKHGSFVSLDRELTIDTLPAALEQREAMAAEAEQRYHDALERTVQTLIDLLDEHPGSAPEESRAPEAGVYDGLQEPLVIKDSVISKLEGADSYDALKAHNDANKETKAAYHAEKERYEQKRERDKEKARAERKRKRHEWIAEHGSDHLRECVDAGYDCRRLYLQERCDKEYPGFYVDFDGKADYTERSCPSPEALAVAKEYDGEVVWLTQPGRSAVNDEAYEERIYDFAPCEAVRTRLDGSTLINERPAG